MKIKAACNENLRNEPDMDWNMQFSSPFALWARTYSCKYHNLNSCKISERKIRQWKSLRCLTSLLLNLWYFSYYCRGSRLFEALVFLPVFLSLHTYMKTDIYLNKLFLLKTFPKIKYLGSRPIYLCSLDNYRNGYYTQFINHIYTLI